LSKIAISGAATGTATFTIESPATSTNRTLTLPDNTGTIITQNSTPAFASTIGVGGATAAASGAGITFPATQSASSNANTLDDYEQGTFTPTVIGTSTAGTATYPTQTGQYTKIGRQVTVMIHLDYNSGTGTGNLRVSGLPFASIANHFASCALGITSNLAMTANNYAQAYVPQNDNVIIFGQIPTGGGAFTLIPYDASAELIFTVTYFAAD
jgi:hypothetical protein